MQTILKYIIPIYHYTNIPILGTAQPARRPVEPQGKDFTQANLNRCTVVFVVVIVVVEVVVVVVEQVHSCCCC